MIEGGEGGHICATASMAGLLPGWIRTHTPYSAAKMGIIGLMMNVAIELRPHDIFTTSYCPGGVASGMKANNATYRPSRFGGPGQGEVHIGDESAKTTALKFYTPDQIAPIVLNAVRNNRPFAFDHADQRRFFRETYSSVVEACYDDIEAWEREHGVPEANPTGAKLL
jgi:NAD(P)-dependent dehydrogenase (short-subunit alcohol dehydrogenase family)